MTAIGRATGETGRFMLLLAAMLAELVLAPFVADSPIGYTGDRIFAALILVAILVTIQPRPVTVAIFFLAAGATILEIGVEFPGLHPGASIFRLVFLAYVLGIVVHRVLSQPRVTIDTIAGAACGYVLLGFVWSQLFILAEQISPGSFNLPPSFTTGDEGDLRGALLYFSLSTLTTVGYGEIHPTRPTIGALAVAEAIVGQLYLAVTVARLVGMHITMRKD